MPISFFFAPYALIHFSPGGSNYHGIGLMQRLDAAFFTSICSEFFSLTFRRSIQYALAVDGLDLKAQARRLRMPYIRMRPRLLPGAQETVKKNLRQRDPLALANSAASAARRGKLQGAQIKVSDLLRQYSLQWLSSAPER